MKHIKLFEGYLDGHWEEVDHPTKLPPMIPMSENNIKKIIKLFGMVELSYNVFVRKDLTSVESRLMMDLKSRFSKGWMKLYNINPMETNYYQILPIGGFKEINISEGEDEYFRVFAFPELGDNQNVSRYFKCDQFEGLVQLLKNLKILE